MVLNNCQIKNLATRSLNLLPSTPCGSDIKTFNKTELHTFESKRKWQLIPSHKHENTFARMMWGFCCFFFKVYMTDVFLIARSNLLNVLISTAKKFFFHSDFPFPCFDVPKASNFTSGGVQNRETKTGDWERLWHQFRTPSQAKNRFLWCFLIFS